MSNQGMNQNTDFLTKQHCWIRAKRFLAIIAIMAVAALTVTACGGNSEQEIFDEAMRQIEEVMGVQINPLAPTPQPEYQETQEPDSPVSTANLGLLLVAQEVTFEHVPQRGTVRITTDGTLQRLRSNEWETIDTNVRSFGRGMAGRSAFYIYIKNDNTLWSVGSNEGGALGDGTGVNQDEPVHILDNVASVHVFGNNVFAVQADKTLLSWGNGSFYPVPIMGNVVDIIGVMNHGVNPIIQKSTGHVYRLILYNNSLVLALPEAVFDVSNVVTSVGIAGNVHWVDYINAENILMRQHIVYRGFNFFFGETEEIAPDVMRLFALDNNGANIFFIQSDGSLWGMGNNASGQLGDETRVPRLSPVHIADNVVYARAFAFLKQDGTFWTWNQNDPTPQQTHENVAFVIDNAIYFNDGRVLAYFGTNNEREFEDVALPRTITFE